LQQLISRSRHAAGWIGASPVHALREVKQLGTLECVSLGLWSLIDFISVSGKQLRLGAVSNSIQSLGQPVGTVPCRAELSRGVKVPCKHCALMITDRKITLVRSCLLFFCRAVEELTECLMDWLIEWLTIGLDEFSLHWIDTEQRGTAHLYYYH
jgi:hypothetical protein